MNKKILLHLCLIGCLTGVVTKCPKTFEEVRVAAASKTTDQVRRMLANRSDREKSSFLHRVNRQLADAYGLKAEALQRVKDALTLKEAEVAAIAQQEIAARQEREIQRKPSQIFVQRAGEFFDGDSEAKSYIHLNLPKATDGSPKLPLYSGGHFSAGGNNFRTWAEKGNTGEAPKSYGMVTIQCPTKAEAAAGQRAVIIKRSKKVKLKTIVE